MLQYIIGLCSGYLYGLFFVISRRRAFLVPQKQTSFVRTFLLPTLVRIALFSMICYYLLITTPMQFILTMVCFITGFWIQVLRKKAIFHGRV